MTGLLPVSPTSHFFPSPLTLFSVLVIRLSSHSHPKQTSYQQGHKTVLILWFSPQSSLWSCLTMVLPGHLGRPSLSLDFTTHFCPGYPSISVAAPPHFPVPQSLLPSSLTDFSLSTFEAQAFSSLHLTILGNFLPILWLQRSRKWWGISNLYSSPNPNSRLICATT